MPEKHNFEKDGNNGSPPSSHRLFWGLVCAFIILSIAGMWAVDFYYAPEMISPTSAPDAVGK